MGWVVGGFKLLVDIYENSSNAFEGGVPSVKEKIVPLDESTM